MVSGVGEGEDGEGDEGEEGLVAEAIDDGVGNGGANEVEGETGVGQFFDAAFEER